MRSISSYQSLANCFALCTLIPRCGLRHEPYNYAGEMTRLGVLDAVSVHAPLPGVPVLATLARVDRQPDEPDADLIAALDKAA